MKAVDATGDAAAIRVFRRHALRLGESKIPRVIAATPRVLDVLFGSGSAGSGLA